MCKITQLIPDRDGIVRAAKVRYQGSDLQRSIELLYPLEISDDDTSRKYDASNDNEGVGDIGDKDTGNDKTITRCEASDNNRRNMKLRRAAIDALAKINSST